MTTERRPKGVLGAFKVLFAVCCLLLLAAAALGAVENDPRSLYRQGKESLDSDNPYSAVDSFRSAIRLNPSYFEARIGMAEALFLLSEYNEALKEIEEAKRYGAGRRELILLEARILTALMRYDEAAQLYQSIIAERPHDGDANRGLGEIYALIGQKELAEEAYGTSLRYSPGDRRALLQLVLLHDEAREKEAAEAALAEALRRYPNNLETRIRAAEHYAAYQDWISAVDHLSRASSMISVDDARYPRVALLDAKFSLIRGDAAATLAILETIDKNTNDILYLQARAYRELGDENAVQRICSRILRIDPEDEITRLFREESLSNSTFGHEEDRLEAAEWHLARGRNFEDDFYYNRAYAAYSRAKKLAVDNPDVWIAYVDLIRKMGFDELYSDSLEAALNDIPSSRPEYSALQRRHELIRHSTDAGLAEKWNIENPWQPIGTSFDGSSEWNLGLYVVRESSLLPYHEESHGTLALYVGSQVDSGPDLSVGRFSETQLAVNHVSSFPEAFKASRAKEDYFAMLSFAETERTFLATCELYLARTGELVNRIDEFRTGQGRVTETLDALSAAVAASVPRKMTVSAIDGNTVLLNKGRWHGISNEEPWIVIRNGGARPTVGDGYLDYADKDFLGVLNISEIAEPLCEATFEKAGDFEFLRVGDEAFLLPVPELEQGRSSDPDPGFRANILSIP